MRRNRRLVLLLVAVAIAAAVAGVAIAIAVGGGGSKTDSRPATAPTPADARPLLAGIPQRGIELGRPTAPATLVEFADMQCPFCAHFAVDTFPDVVRDYVRAGRVKVVFRGLHFLGPDSLTALAAVEAAGHQNKLWNMVEALYHRQGAENTGWVTDAVLRDAGESVPGLDVARMMRERKTPAVLQAIRESDQEGIGLGVQGTPTFFVFRPPGQPRQLQLSALDYASFRAALDAALAG